MKFPIIISVCVAAIYAAQAESNTRFDGIWVGTETDAEVSNTWNPPAKPNSSSGTVMIIVSDGGKLVGKLRGAGPGRYESVTRRSNTLSFGAGNTKLEVTLSADGRTLSENGMIEAQVRGGRGGNWIWRIRVSGVFHRGTTEEIEKHKNDPFPILTSRNLQAR